MTVGEFLNKIGFRANGRWIQHGNDVTAELFWEKEGGFESTFNFDIDVKDLDVKYKVIIGRAILSDIGDKAAHNEEDFLKATENSIKLNS